MNLIETKQARTAALKRAQALHDTAATEKRSLTAGEQRDFERSLAEAERLNAQLERDAEIRASLGHAGRGGDGMGAGGAGDAEMRDWFTNEFRDMASTGFGGALVPLDYQKRLWDRLANIAVALQTGPTIIETNAKTISLPHLTADATAAWVAEAGTISESDPTGETVTVTPTKLAALTKVSREFADDSNPGVTDILMGNLQRSLALGVDLAFYTGSGTGDEPTGLQATSGITNAAMPSSTNGAVPTNLDPWLTAISTIAANNGNLDKTVIVMNAHVWGELVALKDDQHRYLLESVQSGNAPARSIDGVKVYLTNQLPQTETKGSSNVTCSSYIYDASQVIVVRREEMRLEATKDAYFATDQIGIRAIARIGFAVPNPLAVYRLNSIL